MSMNFENEIEEILNEDIVIPETVLRKKEMAYNTLRKNKKSRISLKHIVAISASILIITGGLVFGKDAIAAIKRTLFPNDSGVQKAVDNGYIQEVDNAVIKDNGVEIKVKSVLKDSKRLAISFVLKFDDQELMKYLQHIKIKYDITNDEGKLIRFGGNQINFALDNETGELTYNDILDSLDIPNLEKYDPDFNLDDFKNLDNINLDIKEITLLADPSADIDPSTLPQLDEDTKKQLAEAGTKLYKIIDGLWTTTVKLDEKFANASPIEYKLAEENSEINISSAKLHPTGMDIVFNYKNQKGLLSREVMSSTNDMYLIDDDGVSYKASEFMNTSSGGKNRTDIGKTIFVTSFDKVGDLKLIIKDLKGNTQELKLTKK